MCMAHHSRPVFRRKSTDMGVHGVTDNEGQTQGIPRHFCLSNLPCQRSGRLQGGSAALPCTVTVQLVLVLDSDCSAGLRPTESHFSVVLHTSSVLADVRHLKAAVDVLDLVQDCRTTKRIGIVGINVSCLSAGYCHRLPINCAAGWGLPAWSMSVSPNWCRMPTSSLLYISGFPLNEYSSDGGCCCTRHRVEPSFCTFWQRLLAFAQSWKHSISHTSRRSTKSRSSVIRPLASSDSLSVPAPRANMVDILHWMCATSRCLPPQKPSRSRARVACSRGHHKPETHSGTRCSELVHMGAGGCAPASAWSSALSAPSTGTWWRSRTAAPSAPRVPHGHNCQVQPDGRVGPRKCGRHYRSPWKSSRSRRHHSFVPPNAELVDGCQVHQTAASLPVSARPTLRSPAGDAPTLSAQQRRQSCGSAGCLWGHQMPTAGRDGRETSADCHPAGEPVSGPGLTPNDPPVSCSAFHYTLWQEERRTWCFSPHTRRCLGTR